MKTGIGLYLFVKILKIHNQRCILLLYVWTKLKKRIEKSMKLILLVKNWYKGIFLTVFLALGTHGSMYNNGVLRVHSAGDSSPQWRMGWDGLGWGGMGWAAGPALPKNLTTPT